MAALDKPQLKPYQGRTLDEIATDGRKDPLDVLIDLIIARHYDRLGIMFMMQEDDVRARCGTRWSLGTDPGGRRRGATAWSFSSSRLGLRDADSGTLRSRGGPAHARGGGEKNDIASRRGMKLWDRGLQDPALSPT